MSWKRLFVISGFLTASLLLYIFGYNRFGYYYRPKTKPTSQIPLIKEPEKIDVSLYFSSIDGGYLVKEVREIDKKEDIISQARLAVQELIKGPKTNLCRTIPGGTKLRALYFDSGTAYLDFSPELQKNHCGGSNGELCTIFSIVNTLTLNFKEIKKVKLMINGQEVETLCGHIGLSRPFSQNLSLIKQ
ncbi:MAG: GerMN domain-containing protein [bacterium]|nr:GerMN domain-containing protein [bacterium]